MIARENKQLMQRVFAELANGNSKPFVESLGEDVRWTVMGTTRWSGTYQGKQTVLADLLRPLTAQFADRYKATAHRFIAEDEYVSIEFRGQVTTKAGRPYHNNYCWICRIADGKVLELTEYMDTALVDTAFGS